jgi:alkyldihydroxyacetonephosphate synthase
MIPLLEESRGLGRDLQRILRPDQISFLSPDRLSYGRDSSSKSILWARSREIKYPPDAVVWPESAEEVARVLAFANARGIPVIPFGGGSGVCGGTWALRGGIALDLKRMDRIVKIDAAEMNVRVQSGINGEIFERELNRRGFTLGHFPSSIYVATVGGYLACRSAGQFSSQYGKIEDMVEAVEVVLADGEILRLGTVADSPGVLDAKELFVGSEGTLGVLTEATLKVHPQPETDSYLGFSFPTLEAGWEAIRGLLQAEVFPCVARLYDKLDSRIAASHRNQKAGVSIMKSLGGALHPLAHFVKDRSLKLALKRPRWLQRALDALPGDCLLILGFQGLKALVPAQAALAARICAEHQGKALGEGPGRHWLKNRYSVNYKLSPLFDEGYFADTMEVAATWKHLPKLYRAVREAIGEHALVMAHFSHAYPEGCSIYFTFIGHRESEEASEKLYDRIWREALAACVAAGGTISHHHGVGVLKAAFMPQEWGEAMAWLKKVKRRLDPANILNPGKLGFET